MNRPLNIYITALFFVLLSASCRQAKYVPEGQYLLKDNDIAFKGEKKGDITWEKSHDLINKAEMLELVRPTPNRSLRLFFYNRIDTTNLKEQMLRKEKKFRRKNEKRIEKQYRINTKRIKRAEENGDSLYRHKVIQEKEVKYGWRNWIRSNMGEPPVLLDTFRVRKAQEQMEIYLKKRGFYYATVTDTIEYNEKKRKAYVKFFVEAGKPYRIRTVSFDSIPENKGFIAQYNDMLETENPLIVPGKLLDEDVLDAERERFSQYCRDEGAYFGFNKNYIGYVVDTTVADFQADVTFFIKPKYVENPNNPGEEIKLPHLVYRVKSVTFYLHNPNKESFKDYPKFVRRCDSLGIEPEIDGRFALLDTIYDKDRGTFIYNEIPFVNPELLDKQNFLEINRPEEGINKYYKEYYVERSYRTLSNLGIFANISPKIFVDPEAPLSNQVIVEYDLMPNEKHTFLFEPRATNTNGTLGIMGTVSYSNNNFFRGAQQLKLSFIGGMESQPLIVGTQGDNTAQSRILQLNTFEWGPKVSLVFPKLVPLPRSLQQQLSKRLYPQTVIDLEANYQKRTEFKRQLAGFNYKWSFEQDKTQKWEVSLVKFNFVKLDKEDFFEAKLQQINDPFLLNSYTDHFTTLFGANYHYNNYRSNRRTKMHLHDLKLSASESGFIIGLLYQAVLNLGWSEGDINSGGLQQLFGVPYTQFTKLDGQYVVSQYINKKHKLVYRAMAGVSNPYGNSPSVPYEYSFFAGGSNDIRAFEARTMAPGSTKLYADTNSTQTQIGDMRLEANMEWRFEMTSILEGALFLDAGNIWNIKREGVANTDPGTFNLNTFYKQVALGTGYGIRADFDFLIVRFDLAFALHNPYLPSGERWIGQDKTAYKSYFEADENGDLINYKRPHGLRINFGIGYPF